MSHTEATQPTMDAHASPGKTRTKYEIDCLKVDWAADEGRESWDIEDTEGFDAHRDELLAFSQRIKAEAKKHLRGEFSKHPEPLGREIERLRNHVANLEARLEKIE